VVYGTGIVAAFDLNGARKWARMLEKPTHGWGHSTSPVLADGKLIVHIQKLTALDPATGATLWVQPLKPYWGSPIVTSIAGQDVVVTPGGDLVRASDGLILAKQLAPLTYCAPIINDGIAYFIQHDGKAVKLPATADGSTQPEVLWTTKPHKDRYYASPLYYQGLIYCITRGGKYSIIDAATGEVKITRDLKLGGTAYPSITRAGEHIFVSSDKGKTALFKPGLAMEEVRTNDLAPFRSTPVFEGERVYIRGLKDVYCLGR
jgi:outer membrane protein assembly factor BamB